MEYFQYSKADKNILFLELEVPSDPKEREQIDKALLILDYTIEDYDDGEWYVISYEDAEATGKYPTPKEMEKFMRALLSENDPSVSFDTLLKRTYRFLDGNFDYYQA